MSDQVPVQLRVLPPDAARIAQEAGPAIKAKYDSHGLTCFRTELPPNPSGQIMVEEGYIVTETLPNGTVLHRKMKTRTLTRGEAIDQR